MELSTRIDVAAPPERVWEVGVELKVVMSGALGAVVGRFYRKLTEQYLGLEAAGLKARAETSPG
ncbi:hypothetical protein [Nocardioides sp. GXQ0305]|uniref:hypothetical protein n=1 Tax=Nocardioides sp. GXQ0305 TaxID=3423912 RepID=UPI003D7D5EFE